MPSRRCEIRSTFSGSSSRVWRNISIVLSRLTRFLSSSPRRPSLSAPWSQRVKPTSCSIACDSTGLGGLGVSPVSARRPPRSNYLKGGGCRRGPNTRPPPGVRRLPRRPTSARRSSPDGAFHLLLLAFVPLTEARSMLPPARKPTSETWSNLLTPPPTYHPSREQTVRRTTAMKCIRGLSERSL